MGAEIAVARQKPVRRGQPYDGEGTLAIYRPEGTFPRWVEGPWTQDMDDSWPSIDGHRGHPCDGDDQLGPRGGIRVIP